MFPSSLMLKLVTHRCSDCCVQPGFANLDIKIAIVLYDLRAMHPAGGTLHIPVSFRCAPRAPTPVVANRQGEQPYTSSCTSVILNHDFRLLLEWMDYIRRFRLHNMLKVQSSAASIPRISQKPTLLRRKVWPVLQQLDAWARRYLLERRCPTLSVLLIKQTPARDGGNVMPIPVCFFMCHSGKEIKLRGWNRRFGRLIQWRSLLTPVTCRRHTELPLERAIERCLRFVTHLGCDFGHTFRSPRQIA
jgi:hypothetical protein